MRRAGRDYTVKVELSKRHMQNVITASSKPNALVHLFALVLMPSEFLPATLGRALIILFYGHLQCAILPTSSDNNACELKPGGEPTMWWIGAAMEWPPLMFCLRWGASTSKWIIWFPIVVVLHGINEAWWASLSNARGRLPLRRPLATPAAMKPRKVSPHQLSNRPWPLVAVELCSERVDHSAGAEMAPRHVHSSFLFRHYSVMHQNLAD
jgi:hypothetical protein